MRRCVAIAGSTLLLVWLAFGISHLAATAPTYAVVDLGTTSDGYVPSVTGVNSNGQVSGTANTSAGQRPVRYTSGVGFEYLAGVNTAAGTGNAINANGEVAGYTLTSAGQRAYLAGAGTPSFVAPEPGGSFTFGWAVNSLGVVAGYGNSAVGVRGFRAAPGQLPEVLPTLGGSTLAFGINDNGQVVGASVNGAGVQHAYRANPDGSIEDLGSFSTGASIATAIDKGGDVVGRSVTASGVFHAFRYTNSLQDLDTIGSTFSNALAISGAVTVGTFTAPDGTSHAFVHTSADGMIDLNARLDPDSGWILSTATGVNSNGQIVGMGLFNGVQRAYLLTPNKPADTTPPVITSLSADPSTITPADNRIVSVTMTVTATDDSGEQPVCKLTNISGPGTSPTDFNITSDSTGTVKATGGRTYMFTETCTDAAGNSASQSTNVVVPPDTTAPSISAMSATPASIWPPNLSMITVTMSVSATDDADPAPACSLTGISGGPSSDETVTGQFTGSVKAVGGRTYVFTATCSDFSGNKSQSSVNVVVPPDVTAPTINSVTASPASIWPPTGNMVTVNVSVSAIDDVDPAPACSLTGINGGPSSDETVTGQFTGSVKAVGGRTYTFNVSCSDFSGNKSQSSVNVVVPPDVTAPTIKSVAASPSTIWPPVGNMVAVSVSVSAIDDVDPAPACSIANINGGPAIDESITGQLTGSVKAVGGRTYTFTVGCSDFSGNRSQSSVNVVVRPDVTAPTITSLSATPSVIWPPNGAMVPVTVSVTATDDVDSSPSCTLSGITATDPATADAYVTGPFTANVRAKKNSDGSSKIYSLAVTCSDFSGNRSTGVVTVTVDHDPGVANTAVKPKK